MNTELLYWFGAFVFFVFFSSFHFSFYWINSSASPNSLISFSKHFTFGVSSLSLVPWCVLGEVWDSVFWDESRGFACTV